MTADRRHAGEVAETYSLICKETDRQTEGQKAETGPDMGF